MSAILHVLTAAATAAVSCLTISTAALTQAVIAFAIAAVGGSGVTGSGTIQAGATDTESTMNVQWQGLQPGSVHMATQYHGTSCAERDAAAEYIFTAVTADSQGKAAAVVTVKKPYKNWPNRPHFLMLHATESASSAPIACGTILAQAAPTLVAATVAPAPATVAPAPPRAGSGQEPRDANGPGGGVIAAWAGLAMAIALGSVTYAVARRRR